MHKYHYKGFEICYEIEPSQGNLYQANGYAILVKDKKGTPAQKFHTEHSSKASVEAEIKKLVECYIDFEWDEYLEMQERG